MRLFDAIIDANHRALAGDPKAGLHPDDFESELPLVALTCIDVRLNPLLPNVLGIPKEQFVWLRNAGNIVDGPLGTMMRALAVACSIKGAKEIAIIGHTDCQVAGTSATELMQELQAQQIDTHLLPPNLSDFFGFFTDARANVVKGVDVARHSPLVGPKTPVHGLMLDTATGRVEWVVNGYDALGPYQLTTANIPNLTAAAGPLASIPDFQIGEIKFPAVKIGEIATELPAWHTPPQPPAPPVPKPVARPVPPPLPRSQELRKAPPGVIPMPRPFAAKSPFPKKPK